MSAWRVPLADVVIAEEDIAAVAETYRSGWLSMGPETERFEAALAAYAGVRHAVATANGTAALHLMCLAAGLQAGDEVVVPSMTFVASVNAIAYTGATPVFADVAGLTEPWLSAAAAEAAISERTRAILSVSYGGHAGEVEALQELAERRGLVLLEDAAHAIGGRLGARALGTHGAAGALSFFANKNLAVGEGGAVVTDDDDVAARVRLLRSHGMTSLSWDRHRGHATGYDVVALGFNYRIDEPRATLGRVRLARLDGEVARRAELVDRYRRRLAAQSGLVCALPDAPGETPAHHLFTVVADPEIDRDAVRAHLAAAGVQTSLHYPPAHRLSVHRRTGSNLPITEAYGERAISLPLFANMTDLQHDLVVESLASALR
jgi:dTDP-4-amino-4,6-dideoxygalactose transaminase